MPLQRHMTTPRQYIGPDGRVLLPGNSARNAISEEFARAAMLPGKSRSEKPVFAERKGRSSNRIQSGVGETGERKERQAAMPEGGVYTSCQPEATPRPVPLRDETGSVRPRARQTRSGDKALS